jgi:hypothetical protein
LATKIRGSVDHFILIYIIFGDVSPFYASDAPPPVNIIETVSYAGEENSDDSEASDDSHDAPPKREVGKVPAKPAGYGDGTSTVTVRKFDDSSGPVPSPSSPVATFAALVGKVGRGSEPLPPLFVDAVTEAIVHGGNKGAFH